jgi:alkyl hydroperoxide reductase subunit AhpC
LYSEPRTERMTIAKTEIMTLFEKRGVRAIGLSMDTVWDEGAYQDQAFKAETTGFMVAI